LISSNVQADRIPALDLRFISEALFYEYTGVSRDICGDILHWRLNPATKPSAKLISFNASYCCISAKD
jgi:hypothetical protein